MGQVLSLLALAALAVALLVLFVLPAFKDESISKAQWQSVPLGSTKQQLIDKLGDPTSSKVKRGDTYLFYEGATAVEFIFHGGKLGDKVWLDGHLSETAIGPAQRRAVNKDWTQGQMERRFGEPVQRKDEVFDLKLLGNQANLSLGFVRFQHTNCISYLLKPRPGKVVDFCFDAKTGKLLG